MIKKLFPFLCLILATLCWGGNFVLGRLIHSDIPPIALNFWRWTGAIICLLPISGIKLWQYRSIIRRNLGITTILAVTGVTGFNSCIYVALHSTTAINAALMIATVPLMVPPLSFLLLKTPLTISQLMGTVVSLIGALIFITHGKLLQIGSLQFVRGDFLVLTAAFLWSVYTVLYNRRPKDIPPIDFLLIISIWGTIILSPFYIGEIVLHGGFPVNAANLLAIAYVAVFASVVAFISWNYAVSQIGPNKSGLFAHCMPLFSTLLAIFFLKEKLYLFHLVGVAFVAVGIVVSSRAGIRVASVGTESPTPGNTN
ncbi:MAG: DMT family transporter [Deltaproteobacteria bacterium]|nr:DMT family transporter [Candidatus Anaeroferrophillus wilburensis]MBN2888610.1 DMT family transporter [Deltaproteobacteria bacterium]